jgi:plasmid stabilization system protein ParE
MAARFAFTEAAETQLLEILDYLADESEAPALRVRNAIYDAVDKLADNPGIGHTREDLTDRPLKFWSVYSYLVVYDPYTRPLTIIAIVHGAVGSFGSTMVPGTRQRCASRHTPCPVARVEANNEKAFPFSGRLASQPRACYSISLG